MQLTAKRHASSAARHLCCCEVERMCVTRAYRTCARYSLHCCACRLSPGLLDEQWLQQHEARIVQQLQQDGWTASSSRAAPGAKRQPAAQQDDGQLAASVRSAAAAGLSPAGAALLLSVHEQCGYVMRHAQLQQVCKSMAASVAGGK